MTLLNSFINICSKVGTIDMENVNLDPVVGNLLNWMTTWVAGIGLTVILFTIFLKFILFPLDFFSRRSMKIYQLKMETIQPQLDKIKKQYANNDALMKQKQMALQKKMGANMLMSCLPQIISLILFIYIYSALRSYTFYHNVRTYNDLALEYNTVIEEYEDSDGKIEFTDEVKSEINKRVQDKYNEINTSFLWIKNVNIADVPWSHPVSETASGFLGTTEENININEDDYKKVMEPILMLYEKDNGKLMSNGYLILPILAAGLAVISQIIAVKNQKSMNPLNNNETQEKMMKFMMFLSPAMFLFFGCTLSSLFTLYMTINSLLSTLFILLTNFIVSKTVKVNIKENAKQGVGRR